MPRPEGVIAKKVLPIIYVIDTSGSMKGERIATVNEAMHECEAILREKSVENPDAEIKIGVLKYASGAKWVTKSGLVSLDDFYWNDVDAVGVTDLGAAIRELEEKLSRSAFLTSDTGFCLPVLIFMSDGDPTDDWQKALRNAKENNRWFAQARKIAIAIGDGADKDVLKELTGNIEAVVQANELSTLKELIVEVSASASMLAGQSRMAGDEANGGSILENALNNINSDDGLELPSDDDDTDTDTNTNTNNGADNSSDDDWDDDDWN